jgi:hypothetical protein
MLMPLFLLLPVQAVQAQSSGNLVTSAIVPNRFLVVYRNGEVPLQATALTRSLGGRLVQRQAKLGMGVVEAPPATAAAVFRQLQSSPDIEYAVHDRIVTARSLIGVRPAAPIRSGGTIPSTQSTVTASQNTADSYYTSAAGVGRATGGRLRQRHSRRPSLRPVEPEHGRRSAHCCAGQRRG